MKVLAIIPARGGSKGIPRKNLVPLNGKPLIQYTLEAAQKSRYVTDILISSDDAEIIDFCKNCGIDVPYRRPAELAGDASTMMDAVLHALGWLEAKGSSLPEAILLLQPTSPLRTSRHIDEAIAKFSKGFSESLVSVHEMIEHPYECVRKETNAWSYLAKPEITATRRQDYKELFYYINGAIYLAKTEMLLREKTFLIEGETELYIMEPLYGIDIDEEYDLRRAEFFLCPAE
jgi:N-acylneuraminate cytidylyltransferase/CMP-N,N'-diacetyllegionaminic acid synthase